jgi:hypothetical protein
MRNLIRCLSLTVLLLGGCGGGGNGSSGAFNAAPMVHLSCAGLSGQAALDCKLMGGT